MSIDINETCPKCKGTGIDSTPGGPGGSSEKPCENCATIGYRKISFSDDLETRLDDIDSKLDDILNKCNDIFEQVSE